MPHPPQPIDVVLPQVMQALAEQGAAVLQAPPGAGKTTRVPLAALDAPWCTGTILMLQPRRLATRGAALFMAGLRGEAVGDMVGYQTRLERHVGPRTRLQVITEGILTRRLQQDPALEGVSLVIFDEFHERNLQSDLGLALCLQARGLLREDLRVLVMSATLDVAPVARLMGDVPVIHSVGRRFPVDIRHLTPSRRGPVDLETLMTTTLRGVLTEEPGSVLAFLPGQREIERVAQALGSGNLPRDVGIHPLYGSLPPEAQQAAITPCPAGQRKVVLTTDIAETSLTIEGVRVVVDSGLARRPRFDPASGLTRLETVRISRASATQRSGRAGRLEPGVCLRLWTTGDEQAMPEHSPAEILEADLAPLALELARWGADAGELAWLDPPPPAALAQGRDLLQRLGALDEAGRLTAHGEAIAALGTHPRLAHLMLSGRRLGLETLACRLAALLEERDILGGLDGPAEADIYLRLEALEGRTVPGHRIHRGSRERVLQQARRFATAMARRPAPPATGPAPPPPREAAGLLLALAYPDRIGQRRSGAEARYRLSGGRGATFSRHESLSGNEWIVVPNLNGAGREARIFLAATLNREDLESHLGRLQERREQVVWDARVGAVAAQQDIRLGALTLETRPLPSPDPERIRTTLLEGIRDTGLACLPWNRESQGLRERVNFLHRTQGSPWPDLSDAALLQGLEHWLGPWLEGMNRLTHLQRLDLTAILRGSLGWPLPQDLDRLAPTHLTLPGGQRVRLDYGRGEVPVLAARLQWLFGLKETPRIAGGRVPLLVHVLSPAQRPVQITSDLAGFWSRTYPEVKKDLKGRYPKHAWPDDPLAETPARR
ncbi:ATP-dependent helicase HrpB [Ectothiorhodospira lacustris]|uniref:ATP-dependent helicase HrpB n=1 Tax=Ectothiorhodospira lacustris TaxID=2899127 RepID=UPI001EE9505C|nr:ATP-dependent helicase HrpB [Ectothiorhodospira lacustris]MCG5510887.1 ATP-dependent helicase HrpB [Ectothiorhodospira lacustris]MCG5522567.1 ATP-dependent helicase HrpB [Ectothiorhodospira lacustris]